MKKPLLVIWTLFYTFGLSAQVLNADITLLMMDGSQIKWDKISVQKVEVSTYRSLTNGTESVRVSDVKGMLFEGKAYGYAIKNQGKKVYFSPLIGKYDQIWLYGKKVYLKDILSPNEEKDSTSLGVSIRKRFNKEPRPHYYCLPNQRPKKVKAKNFRRDYPNQKKAARVLARHQALKKTGGILVGFIGGSLIPASFDFFGGESPPLLVAGIGGVVGGLYLFLSPPFNKKKAVRFLTHPPSSP